MDGSDNFAHSTGGTISERLATLISMGQRVASDSAVNSERRAVALELSRLITAFTTIGPILTPEIIKVPSISDQTTTRDEFELYQRRFCLTVVKDLDEIAAHMRVFGPLTFRLDPAKMFQLGPIPVIYYPRQNEGEDSGFDTALTVVHELHSSLNLLRDLELVAFSGTDNHLRRIERVIPSFEPINDYKRWLARYLSNVGITSIELKQMERALHVAGSCMYPSGYERTEHGKKDAGAFDFFREREWRIIGGATANQINSTESLNASDISLLTQLDSDFFKGQFHFLEGNVVRDFSCLELCKKFSESFKQRFFAAVVDVRLEKYCLDIQDEHLQAAIKKLSEQFTVLPIEAF